MTAIVTLVMLSLRPRLGAGLGPGALALGGVLAVGCVSTPDFDPPSIVDRPRVLAVIAEPPEVAPGESAELSLVLAGFGAVETVAGLDVTWSVCGSFFTNIRGSQYADGPDSEGCSGGGLTVALGEGPATKLPGRLTAELFDNLEVATAALGNVLPEQTIERIRRDVGLPLLIEARVRHRGRVYRTAKRVLVNPARQHTNPPPPRFTIDGRRVVATGPDPRGGHACVAADGERLRVEPDREVELAPVVEGEEESWLEDYQTLNARGELEPRTERAFYSWFGAPGGGFAQEVTKSPLRNELWRTPSDPGCYPLWLVVRDGHGGTSACRATVTVGDADC